MSKEDKSIRIIKIIIAILTIITISLLICQFSIEKNTTEFALNGTPKVVIEVGKEYKEEGFYAKSNGKNIENKVKVVSNINTNVVGVYEVKYNLKIKYLNIDKTLIRKVYVIDTEKPNLIVNSDKQVHLFIGDNYEYPSYSANDSYDGDLTEKVKVESNLDLNKEGTYEIKYSVSDTSNNKVEDKIVVTVEEKKKNPYISVSITNQTLEYYEYGQVVLSSPVVTGINDGTPVGTFSVLNKARNVTLRGEDYESFVSYWIAFYGSAYGMHDASWRSYFGGDIYLYSGSHGCINMPYYKVEELYYLVDIGTPVYVYY